MIKSRDEFILLQEIVDSLATGIGRRLDSDEVTSTDNFSLLDDRIAAFCGVGIEFDRVWSLPGIDRLDVGITKLSGAS